MTSKTLTTVSVLAAILFLVSFVSSTVMGQTLFDISADTTEVQDKESKKIDDDANNTYTRQNQPQMNGSPVALINAGGNYNLASSDPSKRNPLAPPPLSSDDISPYENETYQALVNFLRTCVYRPPGSDLPGINQSLLSFQNIPPVIESKTDKEKREQKQLKKKEEQSEPMSEQNKTSKSGTGTD